ncbi:D-alanyl-D-alanine endopeptidase precursor [compost metagenome]|uniref:D-alanyl-D-alanine endopeptidase n=1 Tax=Achromobacter sp. Root83 TaxID=1736602 RepID=UPI00070C650F|nr:D-alanyl-D-alanine endopeptidase [Achromobacter sp. Root83]KRC84514.1 D-alanyl-D-alanine carboxypeptidase [Achromobacter sp. Root83]
MAFPWKRAIANALATAALAVYAILPSAAQAAKNSDPCKTNAKSAACKAQQAKKAPAPKAGSGKNAAAKQAAPKSSSAKKAPPKGGKQVAAKGTPPKKAGATGKNGKGGKADKPARGRRVAAAASSAAMPPPAASARAEAAALRSSTAYVQDLETSTVIFAKNENVVRPIASISKLMTAVVVVDANLPMDEMLEITDDDVDELKHTTSRLRVGTKLSRGDMLHLALMSSENRAANALGRHYPGGLPAFVAAMNAKAQALGMGSTRFIEPTGLSSNNVSSPHDLARLLRAASQRPLIHRYSTDTEYEVEINNRTQTFRNTNLLVRKPDWDIKVSKTGYINEAGECLVMLARINGRDLAIVLLDSQGKLSRIGDAVRIRRIVQSEVALASIQPGG